MHDVIRLDLPLLIPEVDDPEDKCVGRLTAILQRRDGVVTAHVVNPGETPAVDLAHHGHTDQGAEPATEPQLCLHYDPAELTRQQAIELAHKAGAEVTGQFAHLVLPFYAVGSEDEGSRMERELLALTGVTAASVNFAAQVARVEYDRRLVDREVIERFFAALQAPLAPAIPLAGEPSRAAVPVVAPRPLTVAAIRAWYARNRELAWSFAAGGLMALAWGVERATENRPLAIAIYLASYAFGARDNVAHFLSDLRRGHFHFNIDLLMAVAAIGAAFLGQWFEGALLLFLFSLGHALEHYALGRARSAIEALGELAPQVATVLREGHERLTPIEQVLPGDLAVVRPGERLPVDGTVHEGSSSVNQAPITGESIPVVKSPGDHVFAGSVNGEGALVVTVTAAVGDRTLDRVIELVAEAQTRKAPTQRFTDRFQRIFVPLVLVVDGLLIVVPPLLGIWSWPDSFYRAMTLLVAASPCALALGTPAAVLAGIAQAARNGVLIKGGAYLEHLGEVQSIALDKTGTLTGGEPVVTDLVPVGGASEAELLALAAAVERRSQHPLARAVVAEAEARSITRQSARDHEALLGRGSRARVDGATVAAGRLLMFEEAGLTPPAEVHEAVARLERAGRSTVVVHRMPDGGALDAARWLGVIGIADRPRAGARQALSELREAGIEHIIMLTGDNPGAAGAVAHAVGIHEIRAGLLPEEKLAAVRELAARGHVAMVGDGVNDAPALAHATVGIAMGGAGSAAALETAGVALMADDLSRLPFAVGLSRQARAVIKQNLTVSLGMIVLLIAASVTGTVGIGVAVVLHEGSTLAVIANSLRLLRYDGAGTVRRRVSERRSLAIARGG